MLDQIGETVRELVRSEWAKAGVSSTDLTDTPEAAEQRPTREHSRMPEPDPRSRAH